MANDKSGTVDRAEISALGIQDRLDIKLCACPSILLYNTFYCFMTGDIDESWLRHNS